MIFTKEPIYKTCSKEEYERAVKKDPLFAPYRRVPIWKSGGGIMDQLSREPDGYKYQKRVGYRNLILLDSAEIYDKVLMSYLKSLTGETRM